MAHVSWRQRQACRRSPSRPRFPVGYTLPGSALARFADTPLYPLIVALPAKLAEASFAVNLAIPLQDRGNGFDDLGLKGEQCEVKVRNLVDALAGFGKLQFQWHGRLRFYCTNTRIPYKSLTFLRQLILSPMQFTSGIARLIHVGHPTLRNPRSIWAIYHLVIFLPPSFPSLLSPSYSNSDSNNNSNTMATLSPLLLPPRRPSGGDSAGACSRDASAACLYALSNVFRAPCLRCRRNKLICWGAIVPTGGTPRSCGNCLPERLRPWLCACCRCRNW